MEYVMKEKIKMLWKPSVAVLAILLAGCTTALVFTVKKTPTMNTLGIKSMAVMPFETADGSALQKQAAEWLTAEAKTKIQGTDQFTMVAESQIQALKEREENLENHVDALFTGKVIYISVTDTGPRTMKKIVDLKLNTEDVTVYDRKVEIEYEYFITKTRDGSILGPIKKKDSTTDTAEDSPNNLTAPESLVRRLVERTTKLLARDVAPYTVQEKRRLEPIEKDHGKDMVQRGKDADALAKSGSYKAALDAYNKIYNDTKGKSFAAAFNVALLTSVQGDLAGAAAFMQKVFNDTGNPKANAEVTRLHKQMQEEGVVAAYEVNESQRDKLISMMVDEITSKLPQGAKPSVLNNSQDERDLAESIVQGITSGLIAKGVTVVDRSNQALLAQERMYQLEGNVSDNDLLSIGNEAGVSMFVLVSVTGSFGNRRLFVRVLDVERNTVLYQSPQTDEMNI